MSRRLRVLALLLLLAAPHTRGRADPAIAKMTDLDPFVSRLEKVWKAKDWQTLSTIAASKISYDSSDEGSAHLDATGAERRTFLKQFLLYGKVADRMEAEAWKPTFERKWDSKSIRTKDGRGFLSSWFGRIDAEVHVKAGSSTTYLFLLRRERGYWRLRALYRNSA